MTGSSVPLYPSVEALADHEPCHRRYADEHCLSASLGLALTRRRLVLVEHPGDLSTLQLARLLCRRLERVVSRQAPAGAWVFDARWLPGALCASYTTSHTLMPTYTSH